MTNYNLILVNFLILLKKFLNVDCGLNCSKKATVEERLPMVEHSKSKNQPLSNGPIYNNPSTSSKDAKCDPESCSLCKTMTLGESSNDCNDHYKSSISTNPDDYAGDYGSKTNLFKPKKPTNTPKLVRFTKVGEIPSDSDSSSTNYNSNDKSESKSKSDGKSKSKETSKSDTPSTSKNEKIRQEKKLIKSTNPRVKVNINKKTATLARPKKVIKKK